MKTFAWFAFLLAAMSVGLGALDGVLPSLGVDEKALERMAREQLRGSQSLHPGAYVPRPVLERLKSLSATQRAAATNEALRLIKAIVSTAEFAQAHEAYLSSNLHAVNHGIDIRADDARTQKQMMDNPEAALKGSLNVAGAQMAQSFRKMEKPALRMLLDMDLPEADAKLKKIAPLFDSNFEEFRRQYSLWKSASLGGPATEQELQTALGQGASRQDRQMLLDEQKAWDRYNLKSMLRQRLDAFLALAPTVDFAAQTRPSSGRTVFTDPKCEAKSAEWKMLYRAGKEPVLAALEFARQWRREL